MGIHRLNHAVLYVRDVDKSVAFYADVLGFTKKAGFPGAAFLQAPGSTNDHDLGLFQVGATPAAASPAGTRCRRAVPPGLGGGDPRRPRGPPAPALRRPGRWSA